MVVTVSTCKKNDCVQFMKDMNAKDMNALRGWFTEESYIWVPPCEPVTGYGRVMALFRAIFNRYTSIEWTVNDIFQIASNRFLIFHQSDATFKNGTSYKNEVITDITFNDQQKIIRLSDYFKNTAVFC